VYVVAISNQKRTKTTTLLHWLLSNEAMLERNVQTVYYLLYSSKILYSERVSKMVIAEQCKNSLESKREF